MGGLTVTAGDTFMRGAGLLSPNSIDAVGPAAMSRASSAPVRRRHRMGQPGHRQGLVGSADPVTFTLSNAADDLTLDDIAHPAFRRARGSTGDAADRRRSRWSHPPRLSARDDSYRASSRTALPRPVPVEGAAADVAVPRARQRHRRRRRRADHHLDPRRTARARHILDLGRRQVAGPCTPGARLCRHREASNTTFPTVTGGQEQRDCGDRVTEAMADDPLVTGTVTQGANDQPDDHHRHRDGRTTPPAPSSSTRSSRASSRAASRPAPCADARLGQPGEPDQIVQEFC